MTLNAATQARFDAADRQRAESCYRAQRMATDKRARLMRLDKHYRMLKAGLMSAQEFIYFYG